MAESRRIQYNVDLRNLRSRSRGARPRRGPDPPFERWSPLPRDPRPGAPSFAFETDATPPHRPWALPQGPVRSTRARQGRSATPCPQGAFAVDPGLSLHELRRGVGSGRAWHGREASATESLPRGGKIFSLHRVRQGLLGGKPLAEDQRLPRDSRKRRSVGRSVGRRPGRGHSTRTTRCFFFPARSWIFPSRTSDGPTMRSSPTVSPFK
jgi:hypothetical protein